MCHAKRGGRGKPQKFPLNDPAHSEGFNVKRLFISLASLMQQHRTSCQDSLECAYVFKISMRNTKRISVRKRRIAARLLLLQSSVMSPTAALHVHCNSIMYTANILTNNFS